MKIAKRIDAVLKIMFKFLFTKVMPGSTLVIGLILLGLWEKWTLLGLHCMNFKKIYLKN